MSAYGVTEGMWKREEVELGSMAYRADALPQTRLLFVGSGR
jgi:hypothetical protein